MLAIPVPQIYQSGIYLKDLSTYAPVNNESYIWGVHNILEAYSDHNFHLLGLVCEVFWLHYIYFKQAKDIKNTYQNRKISEKIRC